MTTIEFVRKNGETTILHVAGSEPITSAWLCAMTRELLRPSNVVTLLPPVTTLPLRTENTNRPFIEC